MEPIDIEQKTLRKDGHLRSKLMEADETGGGLQLPREIESGPVEYKRYEFKELAKELVSH